MQRSKPHLTSYASTRDWVLASKWATKEFYEASRFTESPAVPTYLVSGEVASKTGGSKPFSSTPDVDEYYMDLDFEDDVQEKDVVYMSKVMLVDA